MKKTSSFVVSVGLFSALCSLFSHSAQAFETDGKGKFYWTGASSPNVADAGNWLFNAPSVEAGGVQAIVAPLDNNYSAQMAFTENAPASKRPNFFATRSIQKMFFESTSGWTIGAAGTTFKLNEIRATGDCSGTVCTFDVTPDIGALTIEIPEGAAFRFTRAPTINGTCTILGGGTVYFGGTVGGWQQARRIDLMDNSSIIINAATPGGAGVRLASRFATLRLKSTVAAVTALFGKTANNSNGIANTFDTTNYELAATDLGDGFVEVALERVYIPGDAPIAITGEASAIDFTSATLNGTLYDLGTSDTTVCFRYGTDPDDLALTCDLGAQSVAGPVSATLTGLTPNTTYYFQFTATNEAGTDASEFIRSFTTRGAPILENLAFTGDIENGLTASCEVADAGIGTLSVTCLFGTDPTALAPLETWAPEVGDSLSTSIASGLTFGTTYYVVFEATSGDYTTTSAPLALTMARDFTWTGSGDSASWSDGDNWSPAQVPTSNANLFFGAGTASVFALSDVTADTLTARNGGTTTLDVGNQTFSLAESITLSSTGTKLSLANGTYLIGPAGINGTSLGDGLLELLPGATLISQGAITLGTKSSVYVRNTLRMSEGSRLELPYAALALGSANDGWANAGNSVYIPTGATAVVSTVDVPVPGNIVTIDGGTLEVSGTYKNGVNRGNNYGDNGPTLMIDHGGTLKTGSLQASGWHKCRAYILNGSLVEANSVSLGSENDSGSQGLLVVSNATLRAGSLSLPADDRHRQETVRIYQDDGATTTVAITGNVQVGVPNSTRSGNNNRDNLLSIEGGTVTIGGNLTIGNGRANTIHQHTNNVLRVARASTALSVKNLTTNGDNALHFVVPAGGFSTTPVTVTATATLAPTTRLIVDCTEFVEAGGGAIPLLSAATLADSSILPENISLTTVPGGTARILQQNNAITLVAGPPTTLILVR